MFTHLRPSGHARILSLVLLALGVCVSALPGQNRQASGLPAPQLLQLSPAGGKVGSTFDVVLAGRHLEDPEKLVFGHPGIRAEFVPPPAPEIDPKTKKPKPVTGALPADHFKFKVTISPEVPTGFHDARLINKWGVSNARIFAVGDLPEVAEKEPNSDIEQAQRIDLNSTVNAIINNPTDVDYYIVAAKKGQRVVIQCLASSIDSRLQPAIEVYDRREVQLAANRNYQGTDAVADFTASEDGDYLVRVYQFTHTFRQPPPGGMPPGSADSFYRLSVSTAPWIDAVVPQVIEPGKTATVTIHGRNLPGGVLDPAARQDDSVLEKVTMQVTAPADGRGKLTFTGVVQPASGWLDGFDLRLRNPAGSSNPYLMGLAKAPVILDANNNETPDTAQAITLPCEIAGRVEKRRDRDWFKFTAKKGDTWNIDVASNRLGAPTYMMLLVRSAQGKNDLYESPLNENMQNYSRRFYSRSEDPPVYQFVAPADGEYQLLVVSRAGDSLFGPRHTYTVRITREEPDFRLVAMGGIDPTPDSALIHAGGQSAFAVVVHREGDFAADVELSVEGLPAGVTCPPQVLNGSVREAILVISAAPTAAEWTGEVRVKGTATINGNKVTRQARPAGVVWALQFNDNVGPMVARLEQSLWLAVRDKAPFTLVPSIDKATLSPGDKATIKVKANRLWPDLKTPIAVMHSQGQNRGGTELPTNFRVGNNQAMNVNAGQADASFPVTIGTDVPPGVYNVVFRGQTQVPAMKDAKGKNKAKANTMVVQPSEPLRVTVLPKSLADVTLSSNNPSVKVGGQTEVTVSLKRKFGYAEAFKIALVLPPGTKGIEAAEITIPAGQNQGKLVIKAPAGSTPGNRPNLLVRATALWDGKMPVVQETKLSINVSK